MDYTEKQEALLRLFGVVHAYDPDNGLFIISPDRIGFGFMCAPLPWIDQVTADSLQAMLNLPFPNGTIFQFSLYASPDTEMTLHRFLTLRNGLEEGPIRTAIEQRVEFLRKCTEQPVSTSAPSRLRDVQVILTVQIPNAGVEPSPSKLNEIRELRQNIDSMLSSMRFAHTSLSPEMYVRLMETIVNHEPDATWKRTPVGEYDPEVLLCNQIIDGNNVIDVKKDELVFGDSAHVRVISPKRMPEVMFPGQGFRYLADLAGGTKAIRDPVLITVNVLYPDADKRRAEIARDHIWTTQQSEGKLARFMPDSAKRKRSLDIAVRDVDKGNRPLYAYIGAAVIAQTRDRAMQGSTDLISMFRELGVTMVEDRYYVLPLFAQLLPFGAAADMKPSLTRYRTYMANQVVPLLPVFGTWQGTGTPLLTLIGRDGQLMTCSPWDTNAGMNMIVAAQTGSGKSFFANFLIENVLSVNGRVWVIDKGGSYKNLCEALDGQYIEFEDEVDLSLNPFSQVKSFQEESDIIAGMIEVMAAPRDGFDDFEAAEVKRVLTEVWAEKQHAMTIDDLKEALLNQPDDEEGRLRDIGKQLFSFSSAGEYGKYFNRPNTVDMSNSFVVLELQQLSSRPHLQRLVLLQIMNMIQQGMHSAPRQQKKLVLVDEAFTLLAADETMNFIVGWYRQLRKHGGAAAICTQSVLDLFVNKGAIAIMENSAHRYLLMQKAESIDRAKNDGSLSLGEAGFRMLGSVRTVSGEFSEILLNTPFGTGIGRLVVSEYEKLLFSTKAEDVAALRSYRSQGLTLDNAILRVMQERGRSDSTGHGLQ